MKKPRSRRPGRPRKNGERDRNARLLAKPLPGPTPEAIRHRVDAVGLDRALDPMAGYALGRMLIAEQITQTQHDAGIKYADLKNRMFARSLGLTDSEERAQADRNALRAITDALTAAGRPVLAMSLLDHVCTKDLEPKEGPWMDHCLPILQEALDAVARHYRLAD